MKNYFCRILYLLCPSPVLQSPIAASYLCLLPDLYKLCFAVHCFIDHSFLLHCFSCFFPPFSFCFFFLFYFKFKLENTLDRRTSFEKFTRNVVSLLPWKTSKPDGTSFSPPPHWSLLSLFASLTWQLKVYSSQFVNFCRNDDFIVCFRYNPSSLVPFPPTSIVTHGGMDLRGFFCIRKHEIIHSF